MIINKLSEVPVYEQLISETEREILCGILAEETQIPSVRELSLTVGVNPNTIQKAYLELARREEIIASPGNGYFVAPGAKDRVRKREIARLIRLCSELCDFGISLDELLDAVQNAYKKKGEGHD